MLQIYCGDGKGKTTAALGLALRAAGAGMKVHIVQLLKGSETSELHSLEKLPLISVARCDRDYGFTFEMSVNDKREITARHNEILTDAFEMLKNKSIDMLIIDEFFAAYNTRLCDRALMCSFVFNNPIEAELVLTGRDPLPEFIAAADYVSEIRSVKNPFDYGATPRIGIEF